MLQNIAIMLLNILQHYFDITYNVYKHAYTALLDTTNLLFSSVFYDVLQYKFL